MPGVRAEKHRQRDEAPARTARPRPVRYLRGTDTAGHDDVLQMRAEALGPATREDGDGE